MTYIASFEINNEYDRECKMVILSTGINLQFTIQALSAAELDAFKHSGFRIALFEDRGVGYLLLKTLVGSWELFPFYCATEGRELNELPVKSDDRFSIVLNVMEKLTPSLEVIREFTISPQLSERLTHIMNNQRRQILGEYEVLTRVVATCDEYTVEQMAQLARYRCRSGD